MMNLKFPLTFGSLVPFALACLIIYCCGLAVWRLLLSPLARIPGPRLAALTKWYETYFELFEDGGGRFLFEYRKWHEQYGPIVRISPNEVHIEDSEYYDTFYKLSYDKLGRLEHRFDNSLSTFATPSFALHKRRRAALNPYFSPKKISEYSPNIQERVNRLCDLLRRDYAGKKDRPVVLNDLWGCLTADTITAYFFGQENNFIENEDFKSGFVEAMNELMDGVNHIVQFPWLANLFQLLPESVIGALVPSTKSFMVFVHQINAQVRQTLMHSNSRKDEATHNVFDAVISSGLPPQELRPERLTHEATSIVGAGMEPVRWALTEGCYYILESSSVQDRLRAELVEAIPDPNHMPTLPELQRLPYLAACVEETLRLSEGIAERLTRTSPNTATQYGSYTLPPRTEISMSIASVTHDEKVFPQSYDFHPERWLNQPKGPDGKKPLSRYLVSFGKGHRMCLGMHLAYAEIFITLATVFRKVNMQLFETGREDVEMRHVLFVPRAKKTSKGVRVLVQQS